MEPSANDKSKSKVLWVPEGGEKHPNQCSQEKHPHNAGWNSVLKDQMMSGQMLPSCRDRVSRSPQVQRHITV